MYKPNHFTLTNKIQLFSTVLLMWSIALSGETINTPLPVNGERLNASMQHMKTYGVNASGGSARVAFSEANLQAYDYLGKLMNEAGLTSHIDYAGNLIGTRVGSNPALGSIVTGSHIDTVPNGGHYDGIVGVMSAIEVARTLYEAQYQMQHNIEVIVWSNEEGGKTGSKAFNGSLTSKILARPSLGDKDIRSGINYLGGDSDQLSKIIRKKGAIAGYVELHIEQGAILDRKHISIGVVDGIVGIKRWNVTITGFANHAGTTPMDRRQDALYAGALFISKVRDIIRAEPGPQVGTVGKIEAYPGAPNVVPGKVDLSLEIRDLDMQKIDRLFADIQRSAEMLGKKTGTQFEFDAFYISPSAITDPRISQAVEDSADALGLTAIHLPSGAGHDAQSIAAVAPIGMIFVPSLQGTSHAPTEYTSPQQITDGANVLLQTLLNLDKLLD